VPLDQLVDGLAGGTGEVGAQRRTSEVRQRTLRDTVDWSYQLLDDDDRLLLERLGVFAGTFSADAADAVCGAGRPPGSVAPGLSRLVERSLVDRVAGERVTSTASPARFRLLFAVRDYARTRLASRPDDATSGRLQAWAVEMAGSSGRAVDVGDELAGLEILDADHPNLVAALTAALDGGDAAAAARLTSSLAPYWELRGLRAEGLRWVERALELGPPDDALQASCLLAAARLTPTAEFEVRRQRSRDALAAADRAGDDALASAALASLGHIDFETEHRESARQHLDAALTRARAAHDDAAVALALLRLALCGQGGDDAATQEDLLGEATSLYEQLGSRRGQLWCLAELGFAALTRSDVERAEATFQHGLDLARQLGYLHGEAWMLDALGEGSGAAGRFDESRERFEGAHAIQRRLGDELNRGWTLGGLVRAGLGAGDVAGAMRWLAEFADYLRDDLAPLYEYALALRTACVAEAAGYAELAARVLGAMSALEAPATLSPTDLDDQRQVEARVTAALAPADLEAARTAGRATPLLDLAHELLAR
jgi:tetratricopeptide (TPR) repeat protein